MWKRAPAVAAGVCALALLWAAMPAVAQVPDESTYVWTGLGDGSSWLDGLNWDKGRVPYSGHSVVIPDVPQTQEVVFDDDRGEGFRGIISYEPISVLEDLRFGPDGLVAHARVHVPFGGTVGGWTASSIGGTGVVQLAGGSIIGARDIRLDGTIRGFGNIRNSVEGATTRLTGTVAAEFGRGEWDTHGTRPLLIWTTNFVNEGTLTAVGGGTLILDGPWSSLAGSIQPASGIIELGGSFRSENLQSVVNVGGELRLTGTIDNTGGVMSVNERTGDLLAWGVATVIGGTVVVAPGTRFGTPVKRTSWRTGSISFRDVHVIGDVDIGEYGNASVTGTLILDGTLRATHATLVSVGEQAVVAGDATLSLDGSGIFIHSALRLAPSVHINAPGCSGSCLYASRIAGPGDDDAEAIFDSEATVAVGRGRTLMVGVHDWINRSTVDVAVGGRLVVEFQGVDNRAGILRVDVAEGDAGLVKFEGRYHVPGAHLNGTLAVRAVDGYMASPDDVHEVVSFPAFGTPFDTIVPDAPGRVATYHETGIRIEAGEPTVDPLHPPPVENLRPDASLSAVDFRWDMPEYDGELWTVVRGAEGAAPPQTPAEGFPVEVRYGTYGTHHHPPPDKDMSYSVFNRTDDGRTSEPVSVTLRGTRTTGGSDRSVVTYGETVRITGTLSDNRGNPLEGKGVGMLHPSYEEGPLGRTTSDGSYAFDYAPAANGPHWPMFDGDSTHMASIPFWGISLQVRTDVDATLTANHVGVGRRVYLRGSVAPDEGGEAVRLLRRGVDGWHTVREKQLSSRSTFRFRLATDATGTTDYRVVKPADWEHLKGRSPVRRLVVR